MERPLNIKERKTVDGEKSERENMMSPGSYPKVCLNPVASIRGGGTQQATDRHSHVISATGFTS